MIKMCNSLKMADTRDHSNQLGAKISDLETQQNRHNWFDFMKPAKKQYKPQSSKDENVTK